ncbi:hypothetical protein GSI_04857 [Ganoderma sinense ZZ0214-1]|uniref:Uncharacterized protein n=1 Tax=Ganoderma sinense ZZ0214-1 TaxID=1077348 RepID=A0A2G8SG64_9APHY|nr:hypothetical protein GSI_04857 [Ganoderma sinense ZZ0214-1]
MKELNLLGNHSLDREHLLYLERFTSIQTLCLSHQFHLDEGILQTLSEIPTIRHLNVTVRLGKGDRKGALDFGDCFQGLRTLELRGKHKDVSDVFIAMSAPHLHLIALDFTDPPSTNVPNSPFSTIVPHIPNTVTGFSCAFCAVLDPLPKSLSDLLGPLPPRLPNLASFDLTSEKSPLSVTNDDLAQLSDAWPLLAHLNVRVTVSAARFNLQTVRRPDVHGLAALAQRCPQLETLHLPELDIDKPSPSGNGPDAVEKAPVPIPFLSHRLKELLVQSVSLAPTKAQHEAAVALDMLFPYLDLRTMRPGQGGAATATGGAWATIWRTLEIMRWGRQNRALAEGGCDAAVPEVPDMPAEPGGVRRRLLPPVAHAHALLQPVQQMPPPPPPPPLPLPIFNANDLHAVMVDDDSGTESE